MKWNIQSTCNSLTDIWSEIAKSRGCTIEELNNFVNSNTQLRDPSLLPNITIAAEKIKDYIKNNKRILISGDYDADGVTSTACMVLGLTYLKADVQWTIPLRQDGYGLSNKIVDYAKEIGAELIITVDNGIAAHEPIKYANNLGIEVIVTDHHQWLMDTLPTEITVDPYIDKDYCFPNICGCMVAYKLLRVLIPDLYKLPLHDDLVCLATLGTIGDVMPLIDENRTFVTRGLNILNRSNSYCFKELLKATKQSGKTILESVSIAFYTIPAINAAGRLADAAIATKLFLADDSATAAQLAKKLVEYNDKRKSIQAETLKNIHVDESKNFIIQELDNVPPGLIGIIAGDISSTYKKPCIALRKYDDKLSGSGRCPNGFNISSIIDNKKFIGGGHAGACGVSFNVDDLEEFTNHCNQLYNDWNIGNIPEPELPIIANISDLNINDSIIDQINSLMPFGEANQTPIFCIKNININSYKIMGKNNNTVKLFLSNGLEAIAFNKVKDTYDELKSPQCINLAFTLNYNYWRGRRTIQLLAVDIQPADNMMDIFDF